MLFRVETDIAASPERVFEFLRDLDQQPRDPSSVVPVLEKTSVGPCGVGSTFREEVRVLPRRTAEIRSEITRFDPPRCLDYRFTWRLGRARLDGALHYAISAGPAGGTHILQEQSLEPRGALRFLSPWIKRSFAARIRDRLDDIKHEIEARA